MKKGIPRNPAVIDVFAAITRRFLVFKRGSQEAVVASYSENVEEANGQPYSVLALDCFAVEL